MIVGLLLASLTAVGDSAVDVFFSSQRVKTQPHLVKVLSYTFWGIPVFGLVLVSTSVPEVPPSFWILVTLQSALVSLALWFYMGALAHGSVAQTKPILGLTSVLLLITNPLMTNDYVPLWGWIGVLTLAAGVYGTQVPDELGCGSLLKRFFSPFMEMRTHPGVRFALCTAVIFSITANLDKLCLERSSPVLYLFVFCSFSSCFLCLAVRAASGRKAAANVLSFESLRNVAPGGLTQCVVVLTQMHALLLIPVPYVVTIKRSSILLTSLWAYYVRKDRIPSSFRLAGTILVVVGIAFITLLGT